MSDATPHSDATLIAMCDRAIDLFNRPYTTDDALTDKILAEAWATAEEAMNAEVHTLAGLRAQAALLACNWEQRGGPENPEVDWPLIHNLLRLLPAA